MIYFFKERYQNFWYSLSYNILYNYGKLEIVLKNNYKKVLKNKSIESLMNKVDQYYKSIKTTDTELIIHNDIKERVKLENIINSYQIFYDYDLIIYTEEFKNNKSNKVVFNGIPKYVLYYEKCSFEFMSLLLNLKNHPELNNFEIKLNNFDETYFVVNNRINCILISYLLKKQHNICIEPVWIEYDIQIIDQNVNFGENSALNFEKSL
jgi:hypothetical protein